VASGAPGCRGQPIGGPPGKYCFHPRKSPDDHSKEALSRISARAGCNARTEPAYTSVGAAASGRQGARADIEVTLPPPHGPTLLDISMIHPRCSTYVAAASQTRGAAAALQDRDKYRAHAGHLHPGHTFVPASVEMYGYLGRPIMQYLRTLSDVASARSLAVTRGSCKAIRWLSGATSYNCFPNSS
jgi:hypothetical protein